MTEIASQRSSLQFLPRISTKNPDMPVVACGLSMDIAATDSAYIFRDGSLYTRAGKTELSTAAAYALKRATTGAPRRCPLRPDTLLACIYDR